MTTTIMPIEEPRPRGSVLGERVDRRHVPEAEHYFRCKACNGWIDARDYVWIEDHEGPLPHPAQDGIQQGYGLSDPAGRLPNTKPVQTDSIIVHHR
jgi:hypothetical protein